MFYVYRFLDKSKNIIYVGKSKQELEQRFKGHRHLPDECYSSVYKIEFIQCSTETDMSIKEIYYINKYKNENGYFNLLDVAELPKSVEFDDEWKMYRGSLPSQFSKSINFKKGYTSEKETKYNKDGSISKRKANKCIGDSSYVEPLTKSELKRMTDYFVMRINSATNLDRRKIWFRNLVMFVFNINLPLKTNDFITLKYKDVFNANDEPKSIEFNLNREVIHIPLRNVVRNVLVEYRHIFSLNYEKNAEDYLFSSREREVITSIAWGAILKKAANGTNIKKNVNTESIRKSYGFNVYMEAKDKIGSLVFLGEIMGQQRERRLIDYLGLSKNEIDFNYYFDEKFALCEIDFDNIILPDKEKLVKINENKNIKSNESADRRRKLTEKQKEKIKEMYSTGCFSLNDLANRFGISKKTVLLIVNKDSAEKNKKYQQEHWKQWQKADKDRSEDAKKEKTLVEIPKKNTKTNRLWTVEMKMEIIEKHLFQKIPQKVLAEEYNVDKGAISRWISTYRQYGKSALEDKRFKAK